MKWNYFDEKIFKLNSESFAPAKEFYNIFLGDDPLHIDYFNKRWELIKKKLKNN